MKFFSTYRPYNVDPGTEKWRAEYGQGCVGMAYPKALLSDTGICERFEDSYETIRKVENNLKQCARWLNKSGFVSFSTFFD